jgi:hypothetical protein
MSETEFVLSSADAEAAARALQHVVPGRTCGTCTLCCKLIAVVEFDKPPGEWCPHCVRKGGCAIHATRPVGCRTFFCHWMTEKGLSPDWKPERSKLVLVLSEGEHMTAFVDPGTPGAWRQSPYYETLKRWSADAVRAKPERFVMVRIGTRGLIVLPDREIDIGTVGPNESLRIVRGPAGELEVRKDGAPA